MSKDIEFKTVELKHIKLVMVNPYKLFIIFTIDGKIQCKIVTDTNTIFVSDDRCSIKYRIGADDVIFINSIIIPEKMLLNIDTNNFSLLK